MLINSFVNLLVSARARIILLLLCTDGGHQYREVPVTQRFSTALILNQGKSEMACNPLFSYESTAIYSPNPCCRLVVIITDYTRLNRKASALRSHQNIRTHHQ